MPAGIPFGRYRLVKRLARGGMAEVFLAELHGAEGFQRRVAIKRILPHLSDSEEFRAMFMDEARLAALLAHPNVVHIYDFGREGEHYFIAMEFVDGISLSTIIHEAARAPLPFEHAARISADVCAGLHYAHHLADGGRPLGLVHRDVSPQNILVTWDGVVKLVDFGIAKAAWQAERTRPGMVKGKWTYMSPEQCEGRKLDGRSDLFSLGTVMYELLTGEPRYRRDDAERAMREIRDGKPLDVEQHRPDIPRELRDILARATAPAREDRYPTAGEMQVALERFLANRRTPTTAHLLGEHLRRTYPRDDGDEAAEEGTPAQEVPAQPPAPVEVATEIVTSAQVPRRRRAPMGLFAAMGGILLLGSAIALALKLNHKPKPIAKTSQTVTAPVTQTGTQTGTGTGTGTQTGTGTNPVLILPTSFDLVTRPAGAQVTVDGKPLGTPTPLRDQIIEPGKHRLIISQTNFEKREMDLDISEDEKRSLEIELKPIKQTRPAKAPPGYLTVRTVPWSKVYEGTRLLGTTPFANLPLAAGAHTLTFVNPDRPTVKRAVTIRSGHEQRIAVELPR